MVFYEYMQKIFKFRKALAVPPMYLIPNNSGNFFFLNLNILPSQFRCLVGGTCEC